jgi:hypothetical protein
MAPRKNGTPRSGSSRSVLPSNSSIMPTVLCSNKMRADNAGKEVKRFYSPAEPAVSSMPLPVDSAPLSLTDERDALRLALLDYLRFMTLARPPCPQGLNIDRRSRLVKRRWCAVYGPSFPGQL